jgi:hypothetical protein
VFVNKNRSRLNREAIWACNFAIALLVSGCGNDLCDNSVIHESRAENAQYIATVFERNCGAATDYMRVVTVRKAGEAFDPEQSKNWVFSVHGQPKIELTWEGADKLQVGYSGYVKSKESQEKWNGLEISIQPE